MSFLTALAIVAGLAGNLRLAGACTTGVASGKATADGRPLLWKNRDTKDPNNRVAYVAPVDGKHGYIAVVDPAGQVWMGTNDKGFCIENSVVKDLAPAKKKDAPPTKKMGNSSFMRHALATCANVREFEALMAATNKTGRATQANFGVIDAAGGAMIFETGHAAFTKFDANDPTVAPLGYVVRSNFTMTGTGNAKLADGSPLTDVYSGERYCRADALFREAVKGKTLDARYILRHVSRDLADAKGTPLPGSINGGPGSLPVVVDTASTLSRRTTVSVGVFHGVKPGEDPALTTMWTMLGEPAFAIAVPCWVKAQAVAPPLRGEKLSPMCNATIEIRKALYDESSKLLRTAGLASLWAQTWPVEDGVMSETDARLARWRKTPPTAEEVKAFHESAGARAMTVVGKVREKLVPAAVPAAG